MQQWKDLRQPSHGYGSVVGGDSGGRGGEEDNGWNEGQDDSRGEAGHHVPQVAEGAPVLDPVLVAVEGPPPPHPALLHGVGPVGYSVEDRNKGLGLGFGRWIVIGSGAMDFGRET